MLKIFSLNLALGLLALPSILTPARANLLTNGDFSTINYVGGSAPSGTATPYFGEMVSTGTSGPLGHLSVNGWSTNGYNFVFSASNVDRGTSANGAAGATSGGLNEAPGQYKNGNYGNTYMWGVNNGGVSTFTAPPGATNFIAADGAYETGAIQQSVASLTIGQAYQVSFYWGGAQQESFAGATTEAWQVTFGSQTLNTGTVSLASHAFSGWNHAILDFTASASTQTLSFLAVGTPNGQPPFALLANVSLQPLPDYSNWAVFAGFGTLCVGVEWLRRSRAARAAQA